MQVVLLAWQAFQEHLMGHSIALMSDNTTIVAYVSKAGGDLPSSLSVCKAADAGVGSLSRHQDILAGGMFW